MPRNRSRFLRQYRYHARGALCSPLGIKPMLEVPSRRLHRKHHQRRQQLGKAVSTGLQAASHFDHHLSSVETVQLATYILHRNHCLRRRSTLPLCRLVLSSFHRTCIDLQAASHFDLRLLIMRRPQRSKIQLWCRRAYHGPTAVVLNTLVHMLLLLSIHLCRFLAHAAT